MSPAIGVTCSAYVPASRYTIVSPCSFAIAIPAAIVPHGAEIEPHPVVAVEDVETKTPRVVLGATQVDVPETVQSW